MPGCPLRHPLKLWRSLEGASGGLSQDSRCNSPEAREERLNLEGLISLGSVSVEVTDDCGVMTAGLF